jgi:DNA (cytosine-5)-methyltransferase 1
MLIFVSQTDSDKIMEVKERISIEFFEEKGSKVRVIEAGSNKRAVLTHYLHNMKNSVSKHYKDAAETYIDEFLKALNHEDAHVVRESAIQQLLLEIENVPFKNQSKYKFKFIDLFAGIGGFRIALQNLGGRCVFTSEWDKEAQKTYKANFGDFPFGDITKEETKRYVPQEFDILCAGFPCQAFSIAGKRGGFEDIRGTLFFDVAEIIKRHQPKAFFLENVKGLINHDKGKTLSTILNVLREDLGYFVPDPRVMNAKDFGVPQNRERIFIVGFHPKTNVDSFEYPEPKGLKVSFEDVKEKSKVPTKYYLSTQYLQTLINHKARHEGKGNGFGYQIIEDDGIANAIVVGGMGRERNLVYDDRITDFTPETKIKGEVNRKGIRKMTPREWARLQGFPDSFKIVVADASAYKQFGNSVAIPAIQATAEKIIEKLNI